MLLGALLYVLLNKMTHLENTPKTPAAARRHGVPPQTA